MSRRRGASALAGAALLAATVSSCTSGTPAPHASSGPTSVAATSSGAIPSGATSPAASTRSATAAPPRAPARATRARTAVVLGSGDVLVHPQLTAQAHADALAAGRSGYDFAPMYASIAPDVRSADLATCELETPLAPPGGPFTGWPHFDAPPQVLTALKGVGYDSCTTASNHSLDQGFAGLTRTLNELDAAGLRHTGSARSAAEAGRPLIVTTASGVRIAQLAYSFDFNGDHLPAGRTWEANLTDIPTILAAARRARAAGADIVVLSMHWGTEYDHLATAEQRNQAATLLASPDIDLILGDHTHVVQPAQRIDGKWVFYGMGNQISRHENPIPDGREGAMPRVTFTETSPHHFRATLAEVVPTWMQDAPALRLVDLARALAPGSASRLTATQRAADVAAHAAIVRYLGAYGALSQGLVVR